MFEYWYQFASQMTDTTGVPLSQLLNAHDLVVSVMGPKWTEKQESCAMDKGRTVADLHPLFLALNSATPQSVITVCELAGYLVAFKMDPRLNEAIVSLRDHNKYLATVAELSLAWKFRIAGAEVSLSPLTDRGAADFKALVGQREHVVEVSQFPYNPFTSASMAFISAMQNAVKSGAHSVKISARIAVEIEVTDLLPDIRRFAHKVVVDSLRSFSRMPSQTHTAITEWGSVTVRLANAVERPDLSYWFAALSFQMVFPPETGLLTMEHLRGGQDTLWLYVRLPSENLDPYPRIKRKLKAEAWQLGGCTDGVVLLDSAGLQRGIFTANDPKLKSIAEEFERRHESTTAFGIIAQPSKSDGTRGIAGAYFALTKSALSESFWQHLVETDRMSSILRLLDHPGL